jgi:16S rRNA (guanine527-N7)-methyltransferase
MAAVASELERVLADARDRGFLGPGRVEDHIEHARGFALASGLDAPAAIADLGSGGGVPALVAALDWPDARVVMIERSQRRAAFLIDAVARLGLGPRVTVRAEPAEGVGRDPALRGTVDVVLARSFGPPSVTAECGAPLLRVDGVLLVSEPPEVASERWDGAGLALLGLVDEGAVRPLHAGFRRLRQVTLCGERFARRAPGKRPLF